jgi:hypothetical protein
MKLRAALICLIAASVALTACDRGRKRPPQTTVHVLNAAPSYQQVYFLREQRTEATLAYRNSSTLRFDTDQYDFNLEVQPVGSTTRQRLFSFSENVSASEEYTFVLTEVGGTLTSLVLDQPAFNTAGSAQVAALDASETLGPVDVYLEPAGTDVSAATPWGQLEATGQLSAKTVDPGSYELTLTEQGNPANALLTTRAFDLPEAQSVTFVIIDGGGVGLAPQYVVIVGSGSLALADKNVPAATRVINTLTDRSSIDFALDGQFSPPLIAGLPFGTISAYQDIPPGEHTLTATVAGNPGAVHAEQNLNFLGGAYTTFVITGEPGGANVFSSVDDQRRLPDVARLRLINGTTLFGSLDFFVVPPGTDIATATPMALTPADLPQASPYEPGDYELVLRDTGDQTILAGPIPFTMEAGKLYGLMAIDGADGSTADVVQFEDF